MPGKLFIVGTPIGNMEDITLRALSVLREADIIAAEDTRRTAQLLNRHEIGTENQHLPHRRGAEGTEEDSAFSASPRCKRRLVSYHEFNEARRTQELLKELQQGRTVALVTDAGMPTISDPGQRLIQAVVEWNAASPHPGPLPRGVEGIACEHASPFEGEAGHVTARRAAKTWTGEGAATIPIEIIPGPSAVTMAVAASGLSGPYLFYGFLPHKSGQRRKALANLAPLPYTLVFFESPYRVVKSLRDMQELLGNRRAVVARELTKKFEEIIRGDLATILKKLENRSVKGEITVVVEGPKE
jgi:16S rRNA (cytidine1402-2'-O)-methyltransferase